MKIAVETADIVNSTKLSAELFERADTVLDDELNTHKSDYGTSFQRFRGDAYQVAYGQPVFAIKCALMSRLRLQFDVVDKPVLLTQALSIGSQSIDDRMGEVFIASGRQLDGLKRSGFVVNFVGSGTPKTDIGLATLFLQDLLNHLTQKQAQALYWYIKTDFAEHHVIAKQLQSTRQNISIHLTRARAELVKTYIHAYESLFEGDAQ